ncbi:hypothetical protein D3C78_758570 [compost metagenome]
MRAGEQLNEVLVTNGQNDRQANRRPQRITTANPVPEFKHVSGVDAELTYGFAIGGQRREVFRHVFVITRRCQEPVARAVGVGHGLLRGEGFRRHQEQRGFWIHFLQHFGDVGAIDVRHKVHVQMIFVRTQRFGHHERAEVRATDTDVHHVGNRFAGIAFPAPGNDFF